MATDTAHSRFGAIPWALAGFAFLQVLTASAQNLPGAPDQSASPAASPTEVGASETPQPGADSGPRTHARLRTWRIVPRVFGSETYSDNVARAAAPAAESGWITSLSPGIRLEGAGPRVQGYVDYQRNQYAYSRHPKLDTGENVLTSSATVEALQTWLFLDARARIAQVNTSPFGPSTTETPGFNPNRTETSVIQLSPSARGPLGRQALYQLRFTAAASHASDAVVPDTTTRQWLGRIQNVPGGHAFGWAVDGSHLVIRNTTINEQQDSRARGSLTYAPYWSVRVAVYGGVEVTDLSGSTRERTRTPGVGLEWSPSVRTQLAAVAQKRFFGTGHSLVFSHRTPRMALRYTDDKDVATLPGRLVRAVESSIYNLMADMLAASVPDPVMRSDAVRARIEQTGALQLAPASNGFLTTRPTLLGERELSLALLGKVNTVTLLGNHSEYRTLSSASDLGATSTSASTVRQQGYSFSWAHQLSPRSSIALTDTHSRSKDIASDLGSRQHSVNVALLRALGRRTSLSIAARRIKFDSDFAPGYVENAAVLTAGMHL